MTDKTQMQTMKEMQIMFPMLLPQQHLLVPWIRLGVTGLLLQTVMMINRQVTLPVKHPNAKVPKESIISAFVIELRKPPFRQ